MKITKRRAAVAGVAIAGVASVGFAVSAQADPTTSPTAGQQPKIAAGVGAFLRATTDEQRVCLAQQGLTAPSGKLTPEQRQEVIKAGKAAAEKCGVTLPAKAKVPGRFLVGFSRLTPDQQTCIAKAQITRPIGRLTDTEKTKLKADITAAAASCGIK
jgi:hypothetical protein